MLDAFRIRWAGPELDQRLADGANPDSDQLLRLRASRLLEPRVRATVATGAVRGARRELMALADDLRHMRTVQPRCVAMAERLVTDPSSPLYTAGSSDDTVRAAHAAAVWLRPG